MRIFGDRTRQDRRSDQLCWALLGRPPNCVWLAKTVTVPVASHPSHLSHLSHLISREITEIKAGFLQVPIGRLTGGEAACTGMFQHLANHVNDTAFQ